MGLRSTFIPIRNREDLTAVLLMEQAIDDVAEYKCVYGIHFFIEVKGKIWCAWSQDGSTGLSFYTDFSPSFRHYLHLDGMNENPKHKRFFQFNNIIEPSALEDWFTKRGL